VRRALRSAALLGPPFAAVLLLFAARGFYLPTLPLIIASSTGSYAVVGLAGAASTLAQLASQYALGALSDAVGRGAVAALGFALLAAFLHGLRSASSALQFVGLRALEGVASAAVYTSAAAAVGDAASALGVKVGLATGVARMLGSASFATASLLSRGFSASSVLQLALLVCVAAAFAVYAAAPRWDLLLAAQLLRSLAFALFESSTLAYANLLADPAARGRFVGLRNTAVAAGWAAGSALGGLAADFIGLKALIAACSAHPGSARRRLRKAQVGGLPLCQNFPHREKEF